MRINKYIAHAGVCSRRDADQLVEAGRVQIDGETVTAHGTQVQEGQIVSVDGEPIALQDFIYYLINKDKDTISTTDDPKGRDTVLGLVDLPDEQRQGLFPVGRLDRNTTGVLLLTNDGDLAHRLMHPRYEVVKLYFVRTRENVKPHELDRLQRGIRLEDGTANADAAAYVHPKAKNEVGLELHEGRNRQIRRMMKRLDHDVIHLERVSYAGLTTEDIPRGEGRRLHPHEIDALHRLVGL